MKMVGLYLLMILLNMLRKNDHLYKKMLILCYKTACSRRSSLNDLIKDYDRNCNQQIIKL